MSKEEDSGANTVQGQVELLPCPFCGSDDIIRVSNSIYAPKGCCNNCGASTTGLDRWNTRAPSAPNVITDKKTKRKCLCLDIGPVFDGCPIHGILPDKNLEEPGGDRANAGQGPMERPTSKGWWWHRYLSEHWMPRWIESAGYGPEWLLCRETMMSDKAGDWKGDWFGPLQAPSVEPAGPKSDSGSGFR
jgi:ribosomal protein L37AE/L43A